MSRKNFTQLFLTFAALVKESMTKSGVAILTTTGKVLAAYFLATISHFAFYLGPQLLT